MRLHPIRAVSSLLIIAFVSTSVTPAFALRPAGLEEQPKKNQDEFVASLTGPNAGVFPAGNMPLLTAGLEEGVLMRADDAVGVIVYDPSVFEVQTSDGELIRSNDPAEQGRWITHGTLNRAVRNAARKGYVQVVRDGPRVALSAPSNWALPRKLEPVSAMLEVTADPAVQTLSYRQGRQTVTLSRAAGEFEPAGDLFRIAREMAEGEGKVELTINGPAATLSPVTYPSYDGPASTGLEEGELRRVVVVAAGDEQGVSRMEALLGAVKYARPGITAEGIANPGKVDFLIKKKPSAVLVAGDVSFLRTDGQGPLSRMEAQPLADAVRQFEVEGIPVRFVADPDNAAPTLQELEADLRHARVAAVPAARRALAIELGGTMLRAALVDSGAGEILAEIPDLEPVFLADVPHDDARQIPGYLDQIKKHAARVLAVAGISIGDVGTVSVGSPGIIRADGSVELQYNLPFTGQPLREMIADALGAPQASTLLNNDMPVAVEAEMRYGLAQGRPAAAYMTLSTGTGAGYKAPDGTISNLEIGGLPVSALNLDGKVEDWTSGTGLANQARTSPRLQGSRVLELAGGDEQAITGRHVGTAFQEGDPLAVELFGQAAQVAGWAIVQKAGELSRQGVLPSEELLWGIGGSVAERNRDTDFPNRIQAAVDQERTRSGFQLPIRVVFSTMDGSKRGLLGAAALAPSAAGLEEWPGQVSPSYLRDLSRGIQQDFEEFGWGTALGAPFIGKISLEGGRSVGEDPLISRTDFIRLLSGQGDLDSVAVDRLDGLFENNTDAQERLRILPWLAESIEDTWRERRVTDADAILERFRANLEGSGAVTTLSGEKLRHFTSAVLRVLGVSISGLEELTVQQALERLNALPEIVRRDPAAESSSARPIVVDLGEDARVGRVAQGLALLVAKYKGGDDLRFRVVATPEQAAALIGELDRVNPFAAGLLESRVRPSRETALKDLAVGSIEETLLVDRMTQDTEELLQKLLGHLQSLGLSFLDSAAQESFRALLRAA